MQPKPVSFRGLNVWQKAADLAVQIYTLTESFPRSELYGLTNQMRRAAVSVSSNIAEGFKRQHKKEKIQFYLVAHASLSELESQVEISHRLSFLKETDYQHSLRLIEEISRMLSGLLRSLAPRPSHLAPSSGFTMVELLISIAIFSILVAIGIGGFVHALRTQREVAALIATQSNASIALEQIAREIRTGYLFCHNAGSAVPDDVDCIAACAVQGLTWTCDGTLDFYNGYGQNVDYNLSDNALQKSVNGLNGPFTSITANNVIVTYLNFTLFGQTEGDQWPPRVTISMGVAPSSTDPAIAGNILNLQTTVSAREIDCGSSGPTPC